MWPDWVCNPGPPTYESGALLTALRGPAIAEFVNKVDSDEAGHNKPPQCFYNICSLLFF